MYFFLSLVPATLAIIVAYFILVAAARTQGALQLFGRVLAAWLFAFVAVLPLAGGYATYAGLPSVGEVMRSLHGR